MEDEEMVQSTATGTEVDNALGLKNQSLRKLKLSKVWEMPQEKYNYHKVLGEGSYGKVVLGSFKSTGQMVAIKYIPGIFDNDYDCVKATREIQIMRHFSSMKNNIYTTKILDLMMPQIDEEKGVEPGIFIMMEYIESDLRKVIGQARQIEYSEDHVKLIMYNILRAMKYLHSANVIHRDLKPGNILIDSDCQIKVCDFGLARTLPDSCIGQGSGNSKRMRDSILKSQLMQTSGEEALKKAIATKLLSKRKDRQEKKRSLSNHVGSRWYRAPEISLVEKQYDFASDMWSLGCTFYELLYCTKEQMIEKQISAKAVEKFDQILFPGKSCFPLSPCQKNREGDEDVNVISKSDQMRLIMLGIGKQTDEDLSFLTDEPVIQYIKTLEGPDNKKLNFYEKFPSSDKAMVKLLVEILHLNPFYRCSAAEAIKLSIFDEVREPHLEKSAPYKIKLDIDQDDAFDYIEGQSLKYTMKDYRAIILKEVEEVRLLNSQPN